MRRKTIHESEFDLIAHYFAPLAEKHSPAFGLTDDAAVLTPSEGQALVFTKDALVADVHFLSHDPAHLIAQKALRVNLSDLAAMGASPIGYLLALALPQQMTAREAWVKQFVRGLAEDQALFGCRLLGGDTVSTTGPLTLSITAVGAVTPGRALRRNGAKAGDDIYVSGTLGDSALGLKFLRHEITPDNDYLINRYHLPQPRLELGQKLFGLVSATMDISDGLAGDIRHICQLSGLGASMKAELLPVSSEAGKILESFPRYKKLIWNGGDDYELLFTAPVQERDQIQSLARDMSLPLTRIGQMTAAPEIAIWNETGDNLLSDDQGFRHF
ncbi:thiamine-phosphate kinase [Paremcibacter congregatus]|uniref:thiamine-phosphate kinase n=1 Tax=Paremcibacter congregatus TaxID=2043170 RepID=UPI003A8D69DE